jgi:hypothetical protein
MSALKPGIVALLSVLVGLMCWAFYIRGRRPPRPPDPAVGTAGPKTEPLVAEYCEVHSGIDGETGRLLTIDRVGQATLQTLPLGPRSKTMRTHLSCAELFDLPEAMRMEFSNFRSSYGQDRPTNGKGHEEISIVNRWGGHEQRVVWHNPPSRPKPPEGSWAHVVVYFEDVMRRAEESSAAQSREKARENALVYGRSSSGIVGTYHDSLAIDKSGHAVLEGGLAWRAMRRGETQLKADELDMLLRAIQQANFSGVQQCYGRHAPVNEQNVSLSYDWDGKQADVLWMSPPAEPKPSENWFRITEILDPIWARAQEPSQKKSAAPNRQEQMP